MTENTPENLPLPTEFRRAPVPAVFMFQPTRFEISHTPERIQEFERLMKERVGLQADLRTTGLPSISFCEGACDCDSI
jgi:hypothetical protein